MLTSLQSDSREDLQQLLSGLDTALNSKPTADEDVDADPLAAGPDRGGVLQRRARRHPGRGALDRAGARGAAGHRADARPPAADPRHGAHGRRAQPLRAVAAGPDHQPQRDDGARSRASRRTCARRSASWRRRCADANSAFDSLNAAFPPTRAFATEIRPGVRETPATIEAAFPWIEQTRALVQPEELGGLAEELSPATVDLARLIDRASELLPEIDLLVQVPARRRAAGGRPRRPGRVHQRRGELQGVLLRAGGHRGRGPELRRQRHVRALPDRRRLADALAGPELDEPRRAVRQLHRGAAGQPPVLPGQDARPTRTTCPATRRSCRTSTGRRRRSPRRAARWRPRRGSPRAGQAPKEADLEVVRQKLNPFGSLGKAASVEKKAK